jgi:arylsulfatase
MPDSKPNILFIMADDIGWFNVSCYNHGVMG